MSCTNTRIHRIHRNAWVIDSSMLSCAASPEHRASRTMSRADDDAHACAISCIFCCRQRKPHPLPLRGQHLGLFHILFCFVISQSRRAINEPRPLPRLQPPLRVHLIQTWERRREGWRDTLRLRDVHSCNAYGLSSRLTTGGSMHESGTEEVEHAECTGFVNFLDVAWRCAFQCREPLCVGNERHV